MCGIVGLWDPSLGADERVSRVGEMATLVMHRGPDGSGVRDLPEVGLAMAHTRLSIIDLTETGSQPMTSCSGRTTITYNGEVYNFRALRDRLPSSARARLRGTSDTEVLLELVEERGVDAAVEHLEGMFGFGVWSSPDGALEIVRDRFGVKPLYFAVGPRRFAFASELDAVGHLDWVDAGVDREALGLYLRYGFVPAPWSILRGVRKLRPGEILRVDGLPEGHCRARSRWHWRVTEETVAARAREAASAAEIEAVVTASVQDRLVSDVPIGVFLSGGIDSSVVAALAQEASERPLKTFTIGFADAEFDERTHAATVAAQLATEHHVHTVTDSDARALVDRMPSIYGEPFADSSQLPTLLISRFAAEYVKVCLGGDGGDEMFGGYNRHREAGWLGRVGKWPTVIRLGLGRAAALANRSGVAGLYTRHRDKLPPRLRVLHLDEKLTKLERALQARDALDVYGNVLSQWDDLSTLMPGVPDAHRGYLEGLAEGLDGSLLDAMLLWDTVLYMGEGTLTKVDRASMAEGLEVRVPLVDRRVFRTARSLAPGALCGSAGTKLPLRAIARERFGESFLSRPKAGFGVPVGEWIRGPMRDWAGDLLHDAVLSDDVGLDLGFIDRRWSEHVRGIRNHQQGLWHVLMLSQWLHREVRL